MENQVYGQREALADEEACSGFKHHLKEDYDQIKIDILKEHQKIETLTNNIGEAMDLNALVSYRNDHQLNDFFLHMYDRILQDEGLVENLRIGTAEEIEESRKRKMLCSVTLASYMTNLSTSTNNSNIQITNQQVSAHGCLDGLHEDKLVASPPCSAANPLFKSERAEGKLSQNPHGQQHRLSPWSKLLSSRP